jgi:hypothetical protein
VCECWRAWPSGSPRPASRAATRASTRTRTLACCQFSRHLVTLRPSRDGFGLGAPLLTCEKALQRLSASLFFLREPLDSKLPEASRSTRPRFALPYVPAAPQEDVLLNGHVGTVSDSALAGELMKRFQTAFRSHFSKVGAFLVGPTALALLDAGKRLTASARSPREFDLTRRPDLN